MTFAIETTAHQELEHEPPSDYLAPDLAGPRAQAIAAIHAYAEWLAAHPDVPVPDSIEGHVFQHGVPRDASIENVRAFMRAHSAVPKTNGDTGWAILRLTEHPIKIEHTMFTNSDTTRASEDWL